MYQLACFAVFLVIMSGIKFALHALENVLSPRGWPGIGIYLLICGVGCVIVYLTARLIDRADNARKM